MGTGLPGPIFKSLPGRRVAGTHSNWTIVVYARKALEPGQAISVVDINGVRHFAKRQNDDGDYCAYTIIGLEVGAEYQLDLHGEAEFHLPIRGAMPHRAAEAHG